MKYHYLPFHEMYTAIKGITILILFEILYAFIPFILFYILILYLSFVCILLVFYN